MGIIRKHGEWLIGWCVVRYQKEGKGAPWQGYTRAKNGMELNEVRCSTLQADGKGLLGKDDYEGKVTNLGKVYYKGQWSREGDY